MAIETSKWDGAEYLDTPEAIAAYLEAAFEDGDPRVITQASATSRAPKASAR